MNELHPQFIRAIHYAWADGLQVLREVLLFIIAFGYGYYVLYYHPSTRGRFRLFGEFTPPLRRADWTRFLTDAGYILVSSYADVVVANVTGILTARLSTDAASANRILSTSADWPYVFSTGACGYNRPCAHQYVGKSQSCMV